MTTPPNNERRVWHSLVDDAIAAAIANHRPLHAERLLDSVGLFTWATSRPEALRYANKMIADYQTKGTDVDDR
jgi:hypothetical protein